MVLYDFISIYDINNGVNKMKPITIRLNELNFEFIKGLRELSITTPSYNQIINTILGSWIREHNLLEKPIEHVLLLGSSNA